jgi:hypothetical protein
LIGDDFAFFEPVDLAPDFVFEEDFEPPDPDPVAWVAGLAAPLPPDPVLAPGAAGEEPAGAVGSDGKDEGAEGSVPLAPV